MRGRRHACHRHGHLTEGHSTITDGHLRTPFSSYLQGSTLIAIGLGYLLLESSRVSETIFTSPADS